MGDGVDVPDMSEKLVAEPFAFACAFDEPRNINEFHRGGNDFGGMFEFRQIIKPLVRNGNDSGVRFDCAERKVRGNRAAFAQSVE